MTASVEKSLPDLAKSLTAALLKFRTALASRQCSMQLPRGSRSIGMQRHHSAHTEVFARDHWGDPEGRDKDRDGRW